MSQRRSRTVWSLILLGQIVAIGILGASAVRPTAARPLTHTQMAMASMSMASMNMAEPAAKQAAPVTVTRLHQRVVKLSIKNYAFQPARLIVSPGTRIIWTNTDGDPHTVTSSKGVWVSDALDTGNTFARVFNKPGSFPYHCTIHPFMQATIVVQK